MEGVDSSTSLPPQAPPEPEPVDSGAGSAESAGAAESSSSASSSTSTDSAPSSEQAAATPSADFTRSWNADSFGSATDGVQASSPPSSASPRGGGAPSDRNADGFEPARGAGRPALDLTGGGAPPAGTQVAQAGAGPQQAQAAQRPAPPQADPETRQRVQTEITRRLGADANAQDIADRMARGLGNGDMRRGMDILERGLRDNNLNVGLAGINGLRGGARDQRTLDALQRDMGTATGRNLHSVLDNDNGGGAASRGDSNPGQLAALRDIGNLGNQLGIRVDLVSHSNGFNTLRQYLADNQTARLGNVTLINPNIPPALADTQRGFRDMVDHSDRVRLITSLGDGAVTWSGAANNGPVWQQQINSAAQAGVQDITVLTRTGHNVDAVAADIGRERPNNLDFARDRTGRTVPRDPEAWRRQGFTWSPENGFRAVEQPQQQQQQRPQTQPQPQQRPAVPALPGRRIAA